MTDAATATDRPKTTYRRVLAGDPAPTFRQKSSGNPDFVFDSVAGRYLVLGFFGSSQSDQGRRALSILQQHRDLFDDEKIAFFGVTLDPRDEGRLAESLPGVRWFWDGDMKISRLYGAAPLEDVQGGSVQALLRWVVIDPNMRVRAVVPFARDGGDIAEVVRLLKDLPPVDRHAGMELQAPVLFLPGVFEPELCQALIAEYEKHGGEESGFMREMDGRTVLRHDPNHKRRRDHTLIDEKLIDATRERIRRRITPEIKKAHQFEVTRMERYLVACYSDEDQGHFRAHRDNTTKGTAHRRFAVSINLSADFDGGEIGFPEYGTRTWKPPVGGAVVFSCSLLHRVTPVTRGLRYAYLPFLYDDAAAELRERNLGFIDPAVGVNYQR